MINKFNDFLLEKEFNSILDDIFIIVEDVEGKWTSPNTIEWDYSEKPEDVKTQDDEGRHFEWDISTGSFKTKKLIKNYQIIQNKFLFFLNDSQSSF